MPPGKSPQQALAAGAFTLIELLVSMTVLVIIVVMVSQLVNSATQVTVGNTKRMDADGQSRLVFERLTLDLAKMVRRADADSIFVKLPLPSGGAGDTGGHDDKMFFYSEVPAILDGSPPPTASKSSVALVGYRINAGFQLERLGKLLTWDGVPTTGSAPGGIMFLTPASPTSVAPDPLSTLAGNWKDTIGTATDSPPYSKGTDDGDYNVLAEQVFRFEVCYYLQPVMHKDPTTGVLENISKYSSLPVATPEDVSNHNLTATRAPAASDDSGQGYQAGSRWYDTADNRAYLCTNSSPGAAKWKNLGMQDVAGLVVALAVLDGTTNRILPTTQVQLGSSGPQSTVPDLTKLNNAFNDLENDQAGQDNTYPDVSPSANPPRLMAEAWRNKLNQAGFAQSAGVPLRVASQVRIYQRYIPLNATP